MTQPDPTDPTTQDQNREPAGHGSDSEGELEGGLPYRQRPPEPLDAEEFLLEEMRRAAAPPDGVTEPVSSDSEGEQEERRRGWEEQMKQTIEEHKRLAQEEQARERAERNREGDFAGFHVLRPDGKRLHPVGQDPNDPVGQDPNEQRNSGNFAGFHVRWPDGIWRQGGNEDPVGQDPNEQGNSDRFPGRGRRLGTGELLPPGYEQEENTPAQPTREERIAAAERAAALRRRDAERTRDDQSPGHSRY